MTQELLVSVIMLLCNGDNSGTNVGLITQTETARVECFDRYVNCGITEKGILTLKEFNKKCVK